MKTITFPSVYEAINHDLLQVSNTLLEGMKINFLDNEFIVGDIALKEGVSPNKNINSGPSEDEYKLLSQASLLALPVKESTHIHLTVGFPFSTYMLYREEAKAYLSALNQVTFDASTFSDGGVMTKRFKITEVDVIPEIVGCIAAVKDGAPAERNNFFMVSLGFGTCEAVVSLRNGIVNRSAVSMNGIRYAVKLMENELAKKFYLNLKTEHQLDQIFQQGRITINRIRHDISDIRKKALQMYYRDEISPRLRKAFNDDDFSKCNLMYLAGGGALYPELIDCFKKEFGDFLNIAIYPDPDKCASHGYYLHSVKENQKGKTGGNDGFDKINELFESSDHIAVGIDIGNANTCVTYGSVNPSELREAAIGNDYAAYGEK